MHISDDLKKQLAAEPPVCPDVCRNVVAALPQRVCARVALSESVLIAPEGLPPCEVLGYCALADELAAARFFRPKRP